MKIGVISDLHDNAKNLGKAIKILEKNEVELVLCLGDWGSPGMAWYFFNNFNLCKTITIFGNNDKDIFRFMTMKDKFNWNVEIHDSFAELDLDGKKIAMYHGDAKQITKALIDSGNYDIVFTGHNHTALIEKTKKTIHVNPGTIGNLKAGKKCKSSIAIFNPANNKAEIIKL